MKSKRVEMIVEGRELHDCGVKDSKGRVIGVSIEYSVLVFEATDEATFWRVEPGTYYALKRQATRDGKAFGAGQSWSLCKTEEERAAQVAKYLKQSNARALRVAA